MHQPLESHYSEATDSDLSPFIIATNETSLNPSGRTRKIIRRHVMKGKNRKRTPLLDDTHSFIANHQQRDQRTISSHHVYVNPDILQPISDFITVMHKVMYPVACLVDLPTSSRQLVADLEHDNLYARSFYEIAQTYLSISRSQYSPLSVSSHMQAALRNLQKQLAATNSGITDALLFTVLMLGMISEHSNDLEAAQKHLEGLKTLINLRGGLSAHKALLQIKCCRLDLRIALQASHKPILIPIDTISWEPCLLHLLPIKSPNTPTPLSVLCTTSPPNVHLQTIYHDLRAFAQQLNLASQTQRKVSPRFFQDALISIVYRVLHVGIHRGCNRGCETLRLAMLALSANVMLSVRDEALGRYNWLPTRLRECLFCLEREPKEQRDASWLHATLWLEFVAGLTVFDFQEDIEAAERRMVEKSKALDVASWEQARRMLKEFVWIDALHDGPGRRFWDGAMRRRP